MRSFLRKFLPFFAAAGFFSFFMNLLLLAPSLYMLQVYDRVLGSRSEETLAFLTMVLLLALMVMGSMEWVRSRLLVRVNNAIDAELAPYLLRKMTEGATSPDDNKYSYALKDLGAVKTFLTGPGTLALMDAPWMPIAMLLLWYMNHYLFAVAVVGAILMLSMTVISEILTRRPLAEAGSAGREAGRHVEIALRNAEVVNAMGMLKGVASRWAGLNDTMIALQTRASKRGGTISSSTKFIRQSIQSLGLGAGAYVVLNDPTFSPGMMIAGTIVLGKALGPIEQVVAGWKAFLEARMAYSRLDAYVKAQRLEIEPMELPAPTGQISVEKVSFGIRSAGKVILKDVNFALSAGESLGIVGPSAAGKSSLARILVGVWKPLQGTVRLDGADMASWPSDRLGPHIGYLPQDIELFAGSIADNIARLEEPDSEKVIKAARMAGLHELILKMPKGYDTYIGDASEVLSGGQRQRIGLARAMYGDPKLLVLDEPNASLDNEGELALIEAMAHLKEAGATVVIITHKVTLLSNVDKLLVLHDGAVAGFGPRETVMQALTKQQQGVQPPQQGATIQGPQQGAPIQGPKVASAQVLKPPHLPVHHPPEGQMPASAKEAAHV